MQMTQSSDHLFAFQGSVHRSNNFGIFQAYYGANLSLGSYHVSDYYNIYNLGYSYPYYQDTLNHIPNSNNFFGSYGVSAGINIVTTNQHVKKYRHSEWRILGFRNFAAKRIRGNIQISVINFLIPRPISFSGNIFLHIWAYTPNGYGPTGTRLNLGLKWDLGPILAQAAVIPIIMHPPFCHSTVFQ